MLAFDYYNPAKIIFGQGSCDKLPELLAAEKPTSVLLIYSGAFVKDLGIYAAVEQACEELGVAFFANGDVVPNPDVELVREMVSLGKEQGFDFILAAGGGSAIDTAKAVAMGIPYDGDVWDFFVSEQRMESALPIGVITTLPSSGSETSNCTIISHGVMKLGYEDDRIIPRFAIMDPTYTLTLPAYQTACGVADILAHLLERYFSDVEHTDVTDYLIEGAVRALLINGERVVTSPEDINVRSELQWLASVAHNNLLDTGRSADWGSHRIEHELSAQYGITHGEGMAVVLVAWTTYMAVHKPKKLAQLANRVFGVDYYDHTPSQMALKLSKSLATFFKLLGLKTTLTELGIGDKDFVLMANRATKGGKNPVGHYLPLDESRIIDILQLALSGPFHE